MPKDDGILFGHMLDTVRQALSLVKGKSRSDYDQDLALRLALARLIQTIGEAARRVSPEGQAAHPKIEWRDVIGMRHKIGHDYMTVDSDIVWLVVTKDLPALLARVERITS